MKCEFGKTGQTCFANLVACEMNEIEKERWHDWEI